jgi:hypothetical protein
LTLFARVALVLGGRVGGRRFRGALESSLFELIDICEYVLRNRDDLPELLGLRLVKVRRFRTECFAVVSSSSESKAKLEMWVLLRSLVRLDGLEELFVSK